METSRIRKHPVGSGKRKLDFRQTQRKAIGCLKKQQINVLELRKQRGMVSKGQTGKESGFHSKHERHGRRLN